MPARVHTNDFVFITIYMFRRARSIDTSTQQLNVSKVEMRNLEQTMTHSNHCVNVNLGQVPSIEWQSACIEILVHGSAQSGWCISKWSRWTSNIFDRWNLLLDAFVYDVKTAGKTANLKLIPRMSANRSEGVATSDKVKLFWYSHNQLDLFEILYYFTKSFSHFQYNLVWFYRRYSRSERIDVRAISVTSINLAEAQCWWRDQDLSKSPLTVFAVCHDHDYS